MTFDNQVHYYHGGLIAVGDEEALIAKFSRIVAETFEDYGHPVERVAYGAGPGASVTAAHYRVDLIPVQELEHGMAGQRGLIFQPFAKPHSHDTAPEHKQRRIQLAMYPVDPSRDDPDISELLLVVMLYRMISDCDVRMVEWLDPLSLLTAEEFLTAFAPVNPDPVEYTGPGSPSFRGALVPTEEPNDVRRLAVWGMTLMMAFLSAPVALLMAVVNLVRGEDLRVNTHVLTITTLIFMAVPAGALDLIAAQLAL
ncbi:hypothetical protein [Phaeobacter sp. 22II1-1F12B]|uniref:hypothetical protein n=1 Tax=Phaeobacter sp. 22II1-1F12B TaxID=1317111 RepID=UPI000B52722E|nr:hypothetical protein [Phaeobacter sp. 22II1-1F12B]OWU81499.1 hypothetical protein ATO1_05810 [Phaeobacter sp. 22II1-1F12B]